MLVITGATTGQSCLISHVGAEWSEHFFVWEFIMIFVISDIVTGRNTDRLVVVRGWMIGGGGRRVSRTTNLAFFAVQMLSEVVGSV